MKKATKQSPNDTKPEKLLQSSRKLSLIGRIRSLLLFLIVFSTSLILIYRVDNSFRMDELVVRGVIESVPFKGSAQFKGIHIWDISEEDVYQYLVNANPSYRILSVEKAYPSLITVEVSRLVPAAYLELSEGYILLSKEGTVLQKLREEPDGSYPRIAFYQQVPYNAFQRGDQIGYKELKDSLYFLDIIQGARLKVERIDIQSFYMLGLYTDNGAFVFSSEKERELQKYQFEQSLKQLSLEGINFDTVDFRYEKPIVRL